MAKLISNCSQVHECIQPKVPFAVLGARAEREPVWPGRLLSQLRVSAAVAELRKDRDRRWPREQPKPVDPGVEAEGDRPLRHGGMRSFEGQGQV